MMEKRKKVTPGLHQTQKHRKVVCERYPLNLHSKPDAYFFVRFDRRCGYLFINYQLLLVN